jgi:hypothetical protein
MRKLKYAGAAIGLTVIMGNLAIFFSPSFQDWLPTSVPFIVLFLVFFFAWGGGLAGIMLPFFSVDCESPKEKVKDMLLRFTTAVSVGGFLAWLCVAALETRWDWSGGGSIVTLQFFTTWSFAAAICLVQEALPLPRLPRMRLVLGPN